MKTTLIYLATSYGPVVISGHGNDWQAKRNLPLRATADADSVHACIACDPRQPQQAFYALPDQGVWRTGDGGATWQEVFRHLPQPRVTALAIAAPEGDGSFARIIYAGTEMTALFCSRNAGETWWQADGLNRLPSASRWSFPPRPESHHVRWIHPQPQDETRLLLAIEAGALVSSEDGGYTWSDRQPGSPIDTHQLAMHPDEPGHLWAAAGDGIFESADGGLTWALAQEGLRFNYGWSVAMDSGDPHTVILSAAPDPRGAHGSKAAESALYRRSGRGTWEEIHAGLPASKGMQAPVVAASPSEPGTFYAAAAGSLYRSADAGQTWAALPLRESFLPPGSRIHALAVVMV